MIDLADDETTGPGCFVCESINSSNWFSPLDFFLPSLVPNASSATVSPNLAQASREWLTLQTQPNSLL